MQGDSARDPTEDYEQPGPVLGDQLGIDPHFDATSRVFASASATLGEVSAQAIAYHEAEAYLRCGIQKCCKEKNERDISDDTEKICGAILRKLAEEAPNG